MWPSLFPGSTLDSLSCCIVSPSGLKDCASAQGLFGRVSRGCCNQTGRVSRRGVRCVPRGLTLATAASLSHPAQALGSQILMGPSVWALNKDSLRERASGPSAVAPEPRCHPAFTPLSDSLSTGVSSRQGLHVSKAVRSLQVCIYEPGDTSIWSRQPGRPAILPRTDILGTYDFIPHITECVHWHGLLSSQLPHFTFVCLLAPQWGRSSQWDILVSLPRPFQSESESGSKANQSPLGFHSLRIKCCPTFWGRATSSLQGWASPWPSPPPAWICALPTPNRCEVAQEGGHPWGYLLGAYQAHAEPAWLDLGLWPCWQSSHRWMNGSLEFCFKCRLFCWSVCNIKKWWYLCKCLGVCPCFIAMFYWFCGSHFNLILLGRHNVLWFNRQELSPLWLLILEPLIGRWAVYIYSVDNDGGVTKAARTHLEKQIPGRMTTFLCADYVLVQPIYHLSCLSVCLSSIPKM